MIHVNSYFFDYDNMKLGLHKISWASYNWPKKLSPVNLQLKLSKSLEGEGHLKINLKCQDHLSLNIKIILDSWSALSLTPLKFKLSKISKNTVLTMLAMLFAL